jgi:ubiquinone/menaquinone biosynthesis C-methylase UbiE
MTETFDGVDTKQRIRDMWASVAPGWEAYADANDDRGAALTDRILDGTGVQAGHRVLELASGPGGTGLAAAERVGAGGEVVITDAVEEMSAIAGRRAAQLGLGNVRTGVADIESIDQPDASFDVVLCREGLMFAVDPTRGASEIARVLRPGGRAGVAVWGARGDNPWLGLLLDVVGAHLGMTLPPPGTPGPFSLSEPGQLDAALRGGGLAEVTVESVAVPYGPESLDHWWARTCACAGPIAGLIEALPGDAQAELRARATQAVAAFTTGGEVRFPGIALVAFGTRA